MYWGQERKVLLSSTWHTRKSFERKGVQRTGWWQKSLKPERGQSNLDDERESQQSFVAVIANSTGDLTTFHIFSSESYDKT
jgi:hypothetical protein